MNYSEKLKDPRWQKKRLEIFERDGWTCQECKNTKITLHVHHLIYKSGCDPWEYESSELITLCEDCHQEEREERENQERLLLGVLKRKGFIHSDLNFLAFIILEEIKFNYDQTEFLFKLQDMCRGKQGGCDGKT